MDLNLQSAALVGAGAGLLSWAAYWNRGEHHLWMMAYVRLAVAWPLIGAVLGPIRLDTTRTGGFTIFLVAEAAYMAAVYSTMLVYRAFFHRLHRFPGPFSWKLSKFVQSFHNRTFEGYKVLDQLHHQYGQIVRTGPMELSIIDPDVVASITGTQSRCNRTSWYEMGRPLVSMLETRDRRVHDQRRKVWDRGFGMKALRDYEPRVTAYTELLAERLADFKGKPVNVSKWFNYFSFDVMGDLVFAKSFEMLDTGKKHEVLELLENGQKPLAMLGMMPWLFQFMTRLPLVSGEYNRWLNYCEDLIKKRKETDVSKPDIAHWLLNPPPETSEAAMASDWLRGDCRLVVVAGSDTTAATLAFAFYHLCDESIHMERIREELAKLETFDARSLQNDCPYLNAFISETLRLHPPVPGGFSRETPPEGVHVKKENGEDVYIPGKVNVWMPLWTLSRLPECYTHPTKFAPTRFLPDDHPLAPTPDSDAPRTLRKDVFLPFSQGPMGCVGKQLALQELRAVHAALLTQFTPKFAQGEDGATLLEGSKDWFTLGLGKLEVVFEERKK